MLLDNIKIIIPFVRDTDYYVLKTKLTKICDAFADNAVDDIVQILAQVQRILEQMAKSNEPLPSLIRTISALDACRYTVRNKAKHEIDLVSLEIYARENLTVAIDEISDQQVLWRTRYTSLEVQMQLYIDLISANFATGIVKETEPDSLRCNKM